MIDVVTAVPASHGRDNDMDTYADDLLVLMEHLDLKNAMLVGHSTGGGEITRFLGRRGTSRVVKAVLVSSVTPVMVQKPSNPSRLPIEVFDGFRSAMRADRAQFFLDVPTGPFFGFNRPGAKVSQGLINTWWLEGMMCGFKNAYDCIRAFSETDFVEDLKRIDIPILFLHGDDDQIVPFVASAQEGIKIVQKGRLKVYTGGAHALPNLAADEVSQDLLDFLKS